MHFLFPLFNVNEHVIFTALQKHNANIRFPLYAVLRKDLGQFVIILNQGIDSILFSKRTTHSAHPVMERWFSGNLQL